MIWLGGIAFQSSLLKMSAVVNYAGLSEPREVVEKVGYKKLVFEQTVIRC